MTDLSKYVPPELALDWGDLPELPQRTADHPVWPTVPDVDGYVGKVLLSYHYFKAKDIEAILADCGCPTFVFIDCGAFSASTQGVEIDIEAYAEWCLEHQRHFFVVSSLDSIGDPVATLRNQQRMEALGVDALPVFHVGEDLRYLEAYCEQYAYVALGGMVGYTGNINNWLAKCFLVGDKYDTVFHGFGQTREEQLRVFPFFSVDSSSWGMGHRYGMLDLWHPEQAALVSTPIKEAQQYADLLHLHGVDPALLEPEVFHHHTASKINAVAWTRYAQHVRDRHGPVSVRDGSRPDGLHMFLVDGASSNLVPAIRHTAEQVGGLTLSPQRDSTEGAHQ